jgi:membrane-bound metal-dependent hydrolase YbcI (DUF457 family)
MLANVIVDVEPFLVLFQGLNYPLHGYVHTFIVAFCLGLALGLVMFFSERVMRPFYRKFLLVPESTLGVKSFVVAGVLGTMLHVLLDSPLYSYIKPFYPAMTNPLYASFPAAGIYGFCVLMGVLGVLFYAGLLAFSVRNRLRG